jgi:hypothetical protein
MCKDIEHEPSPPYTLFLGELMETFSLTCGQDVLELCLVQYLFPENPQRDGRNLETIYTFGSRWRYEVVSVSSVLHRPELFQPPHFHETHRTSRTTEQFVLCSDVYDAF